MPSIDYSMNVLKEIEECYKIFNLKYWDKEYNIIFSNGEEIKLEKLEEDAKQKILGFIHQN